MVRRRRNRSWRHRASSEDTAQDPFRSGKTINGRWLIEKTIGKGSYGRVKRARDLHNDYRPVALKFISKASIRKPQHTVRIQREIALMRAMQHEHIVRLYERIDTETDIILVMEYVDGGDLYERISSAPNYRLSEREARPLFRQIVSALDYCHRHCIIHRDIKPENVMLAGPKDRNTPVDQLCIKPAMAALRALASEIWSSTPTPMQEAAVLAYSPNADLESYVRRSARLHGYIAGRLQQTLSSLGVLCARPAGAFYLYPDFAPWREALAARGATTSEGLARLLLDEWDIATLPGEAFGEAPEALRLRVATSLLCVPESGSPEEREAALWALLAQADALPADDPAAGDLPPLPALERAQIGLAAFVAALDEPE